MSAGPIRRWSCLSLQVFDVVPSVFCFDGPESIRNFTCDIQVRTIARFLRNICSEISALPVAMRLPRKTMPVVERALSVAPRPLTAVVAEFQWRTVTSVSTSCSVLILTCLVREDEAYHPPKAGGRTSGLAQSVNADGNSLLSSVEAWRQFALSVTSECCPWRTPISLQVAGGRERENRKEHAVHYAGKGMPVSVASQTR
jgi:hypothetical protein